MRTLKIISLEKERLQEENYHIQEEKESEIKEKESVERKESSVEESCFPDSVPSFFEKLEKRFKGERK